MEIQLSKRIQSIKPSPTLAVSAKAAELKAAGKSIIALGAGEPDFATPQHIKEAAKHAIDQDFTHYTAVDGIPELKTAIIKKFQRDNQLEYTPEQILVSCGAKHSIFNLMQSMLNPGDEVLIPSPYWVSYPDMCELAGAKPLIMHTGIKQNFKITAEQLAADITPRTRLLILCTPSNPTGVAYTKKELSALAEVLKLHPLITVMSDDIYEHIWWAKEPFSNIAMAVPELHDRTIVINGVSKAYAMTGWRIGYAAGPTKLIKAMKKMQGQSTTNPCSISQKAAIAALDGSQSCVTTMRDEFKKRHDYFYAEINKIEGLNCIPADGAFYVFFQVDGLIEKINLPEVKDDTSLAEYLLESVGVAVVPGTAFGAPGYARASVATSMENLQEAISRLQSVANSS